MKITRVSCQLPAGVRVGTKTALKTTARDTGRALFGSLFSMGEVVERSEDMESTHPITLVIEAPAGLEKQAADLLRKMALELES
jgi:hypothetical protein